MASRHKQPEYGDKLWHDGIGSGKIVNVDARNKFIDVDFFEKGHRSYEIDELLGNWDEAYGGTWMIFNHF